MVSQIGLGGARRNTQGVTLQELGEDLERQRKRHILHCFQTNLQTHIATIYVMVNHFSMYGVQCSHV